jgi:hypothetical protein
MMMIMGGVCSPILRLAEAPDAFGAVLSGNYPSVEAANDLATRRKSSSRISISRKVVR